MTGPSGWDCPAYGSSGSAVGAWCFVAAAYTRTCGTRLTVERERLYQRIRALAATGDIVACHLAGQFSAPDQLLGGPGTPTPTVEEHTR